MVACAAPYSEPRNVPVAYVRFVDHMGPSFTGGRKSSVLIYDELGCTAPKLLSTSDWVAVPANRDIGFLHGYGVCTVPGRLALSEGQRVLLTFTQRQAQYGRITCHESARDVATGLELHLRKQIGSGCNF